VTFLSHAVQALALWRSREPVSVLNVATAGDAPN
jgi:hypothetical protein